MIEVVIQNLVDLTPRIRQFTLSATGLPPYSPGSHIEIQLPGTGERSYSLIDWTAPRPAPDTYVIAVQREDTGEGGSQAMHRLEAGETVALKPPSNDFEMADGEGSVLLLAGGIGVTPLISMASALKASGRDFVFHYSGRSLEGMAYADRLAAEFGDRLKVYTDDASPMPLSDVFSGAGSDTEIYICGPKGMIEAARKAADAAGVPSDRIHVELFSAPDAKAGDASFEVEVSSTGQVVTVPAGKTIIEVLEEAGVDVMYDCQRGDCGICQVDVISGEPDHRDVVLSEDERTSGKVMQICVSRALSARLVLDL